MMPELRPIGPVLTGEIADAVDTGDLPIFGGDHPSITDTEDPVGRLRRLIGERQTESLEILKTWMDADGGRA